MYAEKSVIGFLGWTIMSSVVGVYKFECRNVLYVLHQLIQLVWTN